MGLTAYKKKRNFSVTSEPEGKAGSKKSSRHKLRFVIQKHAATRLHFDFRLEMEGVLKSWAVPKGIPLKKGERHLAVHVEDHPIEYGKFEGNIPEGNYGAGSVMLWDEGTYETLHNTPLESLKEGKIVIYLHGKKLKGEWLLIRTRMTQSGEGKESWLLIKGEEDLDLDPESEDLSAISHRTMEEIRTEESRIWKSNRNGSSYPKSKQKPAARSKSQVTDDKDLLAQPSRKIDFVLPMKAQLKEEIPGGQDWLYEIKLDGIRAIAVKRKGQVQLYSRTHRELNLEHPALVEALREYAEDDFVLDGEIVALDEKGHSSFQLLQRINLNDTDVPIFYYAFDLLNLHGRSLLRLPLQKRKLLLAKIFGEIQEPVRILESVETDVKVLWENVRKLGLEGIVAKKRNSIYQPGFRSSEWQKIKVQNEQEFVIGGYTPPKGSRAHFGSLIVGFYEKGQLMFASKVGTGFDYLKLGSLYKTFQKLKTDECPFVNLPIKKRSRFGPGLPASLMRQCTWLKPKLVCRVKFMEWTHDGNLRHPVFVGLRDDIKPEEVRRERPA